MGSTRPAPPPTDGAVVVGLDQHAVSVRALDWAAEQPARSARPLVVVNAACSLGTACTT